MGTTRMKTRIYTNPPTTVNEKWINTPLIDAEPRILPRVPPAFGIPTDTLNDNVYMHFYETLGIGIDIVTETVFNYPYPYLSEKVCWPILHKRPFVLVGAAHTLELLHHKGFKTFSPTIDETYDTVDDAQKRFGMLTTEIHKICKLSLPDVKNVLLSFKDVCEQNFHTLKALKNNELNQLKASLND